MWTKNWAFASRVISHVRLSALISNRGVSATSGVRCEPLAVFFSVTESRRSYGHWNFTWRGNLPTAMPAVHLESTPTGGRWILVDETELQRVVDKQRRMNWSPRLSVSSFLQDWKLLNGRKYHYRSNTIRNKWWPNLADMRVFEKTAVTVVLWSTH